VSRSFLTTAPAFATYAGLRVEISIAWGADLTDMTGASWTWTDITDDVILKDGQSISIKVGRPDESSITQTSELTLELDNRDGAYSNDGMSPNWPNVKRGTPVRVRVSTNGGTNWSTRYQGQAVGFTPHWDPETGRWATVTLTAAGPLRILDQGTLPFMSAFKSNILASGDSSIIGYWPIEDGVNSTRIGAAYPSTAIPFPMTPYKGGSAFLGQGNQSAAEFACSGPLPNAGSYETRSFPSFTSTGALSLSMLMYVQADWFTPPEGAPWSDHSLMSIMLSSTSAWIVMADTREKALKLSYFTNMPPNVLQYGGVGSLNSATRAFDTGYITGFGAAGDSVLVHLTLEDVGSSTDFELRVYTSATGGTSTAFSGNAGVSASLNPFGIVANANFGTGEPGKTTLGHVVFQNSAVLTPGVVNRLLSYRGETVVNRLSRLASIAKMPINILDSAHTETSTSITTTCGPQYYDTLPAILRETEATGQGLLYDGLSQGLTYVTRKYRMAAANGPAALTLNAAAGHVMEPFSPIDDDQILFNHCTVSRRGGANAVEHIDITGPEGTDAVGDRATSLTVNCLDDAGLIRYAQWSVNVGTQPGYRYPEIAFALETNPALIPGWLTCTPQSRIDITNITAIRAQHPNHPIRLLLEGWQETIDAFSWRVTANTSAAEAWNVVRLAAATGSIGDDICHMDTDSSQLSASVAAGAMSISVRTNSGPRWVATSEDADSFPFDIDLSGIRATVTAISGTTSPQTFTLSAPLPRAFTGSTTPGAGAPVKVWRQAVFGL
jgi:hypothetical protein